MRTLTLCVVLGFVLLCVSRVSCKPTEEPKHVIRTDEDDSDMLMEPDEHIGAIYTSPAARQFKPSLPDYSTIDRTMQGEQQQQDSQESQESPESPASAAQNYYPTYYHEAPPALGHSRPYYPVQQEVRYTQPQPIAPPQQPVYHQDQAVLGSSDFGVIRGGTFYQNDDPPFRGGESNDYYSYYNNGHGRPHAAPYVQHAQQYPEEQFANFRDFADINVPTDGQYSQFVVVYANKNTTTVHPNPKNIFEQLELLDKEDKEAKEKETIENGENVNVKELTESEESNNVKLSKTKAKLSATKTEKKYKKKMGPKDDLEPLLALS